MSAAPCSAPRRSTIARRLPARVFSTLLFAKNGRVVTSGGAELAQRAHRQLLGRFADAPHGRRLRLLEDVDQRQIRNALAVGDAAPLQPGERLALQAAPEFAEQA